MSETPEPAPSRETMCDICHRLRPPDRIDALTVRLPPLAAVRRSHVGVHYCNDSPTCWGAAMRYDPTAAIPSAPGRESMSIWTVYDRPSDYPHSVVATRHEVDAKGHRPTEDVIVSSDLARVRPLLRAMGLTRLPRDEQDDPNIVETWI